MIAVGAVSLSLALLGQPRSDSAESAFAILGALELEDVELDLLKQRRAVLSARRRMAGLERLHLKGSIVESQFQAEKLNLRYQEAVEAELEASRELIAYRRRVLNREVVADRDQAIALIRNVLQKRETAARISFDYLNALFAAKELLFKKALIRQSERDAAERDSLQAESRLWLVRVQLARLDSETAKTDPKNQRLVVRSRIEYLRAKIRHEEFLAVDARSQTDLARRRFRLGLIDQAELNAFERFSDFETAALEADRKQLGSLQPPDWPKPGADANKTR